MFSNYGVSGCVELINPNVTFCLFIIRLKYNLHQLTQKRSWCVYKEQNRESRSWVDRFVFRNRGAWRHQKDRSWVRSKKSSIKLFSQTVEILSSPPPRKYAVEKEWTLHSNSNNIGGEPSSKRTWNKSGHKRVTRWWIQVSANLHLLRI